MGKTFNTYVEFPLEDPAHFPSTKSSPKTALWGEGVESSVPRKTLRLTNGDPRWIVEVGSLDLNLPQLLNHDTEIIIILVFELA